jgi:hypothetical protein
MTGQLVKFGLLYAQLGEDAFPEGKDAIVCADSKCNRLIRAGDFCFIDTTDQGGILCELCGPCVRYARKKDAERQQNTT